MNSQADFSSRSCIFARAALVLWFKPAILAALLLSLVCGCQTGGSWFLPIGAAGNRDRSSDKNHEPAKESAAENSAKSNSESAKNSELQTKSKIDPFKPLADENWVLAVSPPDETALPRYRWRHIVLEEILDRPRDKQPNWQLGLASDKPIVAVNAAIAMARLGEGHPEEALATAVRAPELKLPVRRAAVEALGTVQSEESVKQLGELVNQYSRFTGEFRSRYVPELHAELIRSLAKSPEGITDPRIAEALKSPAAVVKSEALEALSSVPADKATQLPPLAADLTTDADPQVRIAALRLLATRQHPQAGDKVLRAISDHEFPVRAAAIELLGQTGDQAAHEQLKRLAADHAELIRVAAVRALAQMDDRDSVEAAAGDASWRVRRAVAVSLGKHPDRSSATLARQFLTDASVEVQREAVHATSAWPAEKAGPILLLGMESPNYLTRKESATLLADRWPTAAGFPIDAPAPRRAELTAQLEAELTSQFGNIDQSAMAKNVKSSAADISPETKQKVAHLIEVLSNRRAAANEQIAAQNELIIMGEDLPPVLDALLCETNRPLPPQIYREVLPHCGKEFELVDQLSDDKQATRRSAMAGLTKFVEEKNLSAVALARVSELLTTETDPVIWLAAFKLIEHDPREPAALLAAAGMGHGSPEVRRRACSYFTTFPDIHRTELLLATLADTNVAVQHAAVEALAELPPLENSRPLENLLAAPDHFLRLDAAVTLTRGKQPAGRAALERLAADDDSQVRRKTAQAIGKLDDSAMLPTLVRLLDDQQDVRRAALASLRSLTGWEKPPVDGGPRQAAFQSAATGPNAASTLAEQAQSWKEWYRRQSSEH